MADKFDKSAYVHKYVNGIWTPKQEAWGIRCKWLLYWCKIQNYGHFWIFSSKEDTLEGLNIKKKCGKRSWLGSNLSVPWWCDVFLVPTSFLDLQMGQRNLHLKLAEALLILFPTSRRTLPTLALVGKLLDQTYIFRKNLSIVIVYFLSGPLQCFHIVEKLQYFPSRIL